MITPSEKIYHELRQLVRTLTRVAVFWYVTAIFFEAVLPGFVTKRLRLDLFLSAVIISVVLWYFFVFSNHRTERIKNIL